MSIQRVPFNALGPLLPDNSGKRRPADARSSQSSHSSPITGIHLWFDREITTLEHAALLDRTIQWMFHKSRIIKSRENPEDAPGSYVELVVSSLETWLKNRSPRSSIWR